MERFLLRKFTNHLMGIPWGLMFVLDETKFCNITFYTTKYQLAFCYTTSKDL